MRPATAIRLSVSAVVCMVSVAGAEPTRESLEQTLDEMERAVLAADPDAYMAHVAAADAVFRQEQANWAKDLTRHEPPAAFELAIDADNVSIFEGDLSPGTKTAHADLTMSWRLAGSSEQREVTHPVTFVYDEGAGAWRYAGEAWSVLERRGVRVMYLGDLLPVATRIAELAPPIQAHVHDELGTTLEAPLRIKLYGSMRHLQASIYISYTDGLGGWNEPGEAVKILARSRTPDRQLRTLLAHEYGHVVSFALGERATTMPWWTLEGVAELCAEPYAGKADRTRRSMRRRAADGSLVEWPRLADFHGEAKHHAGAVYAQGFDMVRFVTDRWGAGARNRWLVALARGEPIDEASKEALGVSFDELDRAWREMLADDG